MPAPQSVIVVGGGVGGFAAVQALRNRGYAGRLTLVNPEGIPYDRPPLSKGYLAGTQDAEAIALAADPWFADHSVDLVVDRAVSLDPAARTITLAGGGERSADAVVLATGGRPRRLSVPGGDDPGLLTLRWRADADRLRSRIAPGRRLAIVGAGLIGSEVAATARGAGADVTLIDPVAVSLVPALGAELAGVLQAMHAEHGVAVVTGVTVGFTRGPSGWLVEIEGAEPVEADDVLLAVGMLPEVALASAAGLAVDDGILVDAAGRTSAEGVWALGDASRLVVNGVPQRRFEHWDSATGSARRTAASVLGEDVPAVRAPYFWTDRYGISAEAAGSMAAGRPVRRARDGRLVADFRLADDGRLLGAAALDGGSVITACRRIIDREVVVEPDALADPTVDLRPLSR